MIESCPHCGGTTGYQSVSTNKLIKLTGWDGNCYDSELEYVSGGFRKNCHDCGKNVSKLVSELP